MLRCKTCPHSFHHTCLQLSATLEDNICAECSNGRHPVYGDMVWAKVSKYPWLPAIIVPPCRIPSYIQNTHHRQHDLCVRFFGEYNFEWIGREFVYRFSKDNSTLAHKALKYNKAIVSAKKWFEKIKFIDWNKTSSINAPCPMAYITIAENTFVEPAKLVLDKYNEAVLCECQPNDKDPCGPTSKCTNRMAYIECNDLCPCAAQCRNKSIQRRIYSKANVTFLGFDKGFGLISSEVIARGSVVIEYIGEVITKSEYQCRMQDKERRNCYVMKYTRELFIDAELKGNLSRFINHSCNPNCLYEKWSVKGINLVVVIASQVIPKVSKSS